MKTRATGASQREAPATSVDAAQSGLVPPCPGNAPTLHELQQALDQSRGALAVATSAASADRSAARASLERAQNLGAEVFRLRDQLQAARLDADESYCRVLDMERLYRQEQARLAELNVQHHQMGEHLSQELTVHQQDGIHWQAELARVLEVHAQDAAVWKAEMEGLQRSSQQDAAVWKAEIGRLQRSNQQDAEVWKAELERSQRAHQQQADVWKTALDAARHARADDDG